MPPMQDGPMTFTSKAEEKWFSQPRIQVLVERMRDLGERARANATTKHERKMLAKFYTNDGLKRRVKLLFEPTVVEALNRIWTAADTDQSHSIEKNEYLVMHRKVRRSFFCAPEKIPKKILTPHILIDLARACCLVTFIRSWCSRSIRRRSQRKPSRPPRRIGSRTPRAR